jgi:hypothetical protein
MAREVELFCECLNAYLMGVFGCRRPPATVTLSGCVVARRKDFDLYLRYKPDAGLWKGEALVIARIGFKRTGVGQGTALLAHLVGLAGRFGIRTIGIEMAHSPSIKAFAAKYRFREVDPNNWLADTSVIEQYVRGCTQVSEVRKHGHARRPT